MDDQFDLNPSDQLERNDTPLAEPPVPQTDEIHHAPAVPRRRRKKRRKRPTWQRMLWKYWPPIRFGLIILAGVLLVWLLFSSIGAMFTGPEETEPSATTEPTTEPTTAPTDPPTEPTVPPTDPPTEPTAPPDPFAGAVTEDWYDNTLFIGDFSFAGLRDSARAGSADYFCTANMGVFNWDEETTSDKGFEKQNLASLLASKTYEKVIINIGINNCGYPTASLIKSYSGLVDAVKAAQPNAKIVLHGIMLVSKNYAKDRDYFTPSHIAEVNQRIEAMANGESVFYINVNDSFADSNGWLISSASTDGCHFTSSAYKDWAKLMGVALGKLDIE